MRRESVFRSITAALLVTAAAISVYHRHRAEQAGRGEISLQEEGLPTAVALRSSGPVPLGETSPLHGRDLVLQVAWHGGGELVYGAGKPCGTGDALDPAAQRGEEADREVR
jgi:hypothetical protein